MELLQIAPGIVYYPRFIDYPDATLDDVMTQVTFVQRSRMLYGRRVATPRMEAWYGPQPYHFGGSELPAAELPPVLRALAVRCEHVVTDARFASCLVNLYRDGRDSVAYHSDDEPEMHDPIVASVSLGAPRVFLLQRKNPTPALASAIMPNRRSVTLEHGSLLVMHRGIQAEWVHSLPKMRGCTERRVNLTFRDTSPT